MISSSTTSGAALGEFFGEEDMIFGTPVVNEVEDVGVFRVTTLMKTAEQMSALLTRC